MSGINQISLLLSLFQGSSTSALTGSSSSSGAGFLDILNAVMPGAATNSPGSASDLPDGSLSASGRKLSLFDPESAFRMMTDINQREVSYQGEFSEMTDMQAWAATPEQPAFLPKLSALNTIPIAPQSQTFLSLCRSCRTFACRCVHHSTPPW